jgi:hypothetical protein
VQQRIPAGQIRDLHVIGDEIAGQPRFESVRPLRQASDPEHGIRPLGEGDAKLQAALGIGHAGREGNLPAEHPAHILGDLSVEKTHRIRPAELQQGLWTDFDFLELTHD